MSFKALWNELLKGELVVPSKEAVMELGKITWKLTCLDSWPRFEKSSFQV